MCVWLSSFRSGPGKCCLDPSRKRAPPICMGACLRQHLPLPETSVARNKLIVSNKHKVPLPTSDRGTLRNWLVNSYFQETHDVPLGKGSDEEELNSTFTYDHLGRLFRGDVCDAESTPVRTDLLEYDRNGNILRHAKKRGVGSGIVTDTCNYTGNRLLRGTKRNVCKEGRMLNGVDG